MDRKLEFLQSSTERNMKQNYTFLSCSASILSVAFFAACAKSKCAASSASKSDGILYSDELRMKASASSDTTNVDSTFLRDLTLTDADGMMSYTSILASHSLHLSFHVHQHRWRHAARQHVTRGSALLRPYQQQVWAYGVLPHRTHSSSRTWAACAGCSWSGSRLCEKRGQTIHYF
ncbi:hypothetical protein V7S43_017852 [Phytophthora oleae]|uniref:RxLR effector protein n=1 Tax=Phytophthora oleae TaxID=2107226 RepID=A0ABD3EV79_9STRA